jgi:rod shape-determining protein MreD
MSTRWPQTSQTGRTSGVLRRLLPPLLLVAAVVVAVLPGVPQPFSLASLLPVLVIHAWSLRGGDHIPAIAACGAGLIVDAVSNGPLGYFALLYLMTARLAAMARGLAGGGWVAHGLAVGANLAALAILQWAIVLVFELKPVGIAQLLEATAMAIVAYPLAALALRMAEPAPPALQMAAFVRINQS